MRQRCKRFAAAAYPLLCGLCVLWFWLGLRPGDEMGFALLVFYLLLPAGAVVCAFLRARQGGRVGWVPPLFGLSAMLTEYLTFALANTRAAGHLNSPEPTLLAVGVLCATVGIALSKASKRRENRQK